MKKKSFILYVDYYEYIKDLPFEEIGKLTVALYEFMLGNENYSLEGETKMAFKFIKSQIARDCEKYEQKVEKMSRLAKEQWKIRKEKDAFAYNCTQTHGDNENDNDNVNDNVSVNENDNERKPAYYGKYRKKNNSHPAPASYDFDEIMRRNDERELVYVSKNKKENAKNEN